MNDEEERLHAEADVSGGEDDGGNVGPGSTASRHVMRDGGRQMADRMSAAEKDAAHKAAGPRAQMRAVQTVDRLLRAYQARLPPLLAGTPQPSRRRCGGVLVTACRNHAPSFMMLMHMLAHHACRRAAAHALVALCMALMHVCMQEHRETELSRAVVLQDMRSRYLHAVSAVFAEGFEKGYLSGEQQAALHAMVARELDDTSQPMNDARHLDGLARPPVYIRWLVRALATLGHVVPLLKNIADKVRT